MINIIVIVEGNNGVHECARVVPTWLFTVTRYVSERCAGQFRRRRAAAVAVHQSPTCATMAIVNKGIAPMRQEQCTAERAQTTGGRWGLTHTQLLTVLPGSRLITS